MTQQNQTLLGAAIGTAIGLGILYLVVRVVSSAWSAGSK